MIVELFAGFSTIMTDPIALLWILIGITTGTLIGALPGVGPVTGIAVLLPLTFQLEPISGLVLLMSVYLGAMFGGRISSILINIPGDEGAIVTTFDGYPLTQQGRAGYALTLSAVGSFVGGMFGFLGLVFFINVLVKVATIFGPTDYFSLMVFTLVITCVIGQENQLKSLISMFLGLLISVIGIDAVTGTERLTFGVMTLWDGIHLAVVAIGIFGLSEAILLLEGNNKNKKVASKVNFRSLFPKLSEILSNWAAILRGSIIGFIVGVLPGSGTVLATFLSYSVEKKVSKTPEQFGKGMPQGLSGPESANNASVGGALIPTLALGIPGSGTAAILLGGLMIIGLQPGPLLFVNSGHIVWPAIAAMFIANILLLIVNILFIPSFSYLIRKATPYMAILIATLCIVGVYSVQFRLFDVGIMIVLGILGYLMRKTGFPLAPLFLAVVLGPLIEKNMKQSLLVSLGDYSIFFTKPISLVFMVLTIVMILWPLIQRIIKMRKQLN